MGSNMEITDPRQQFIAIMVSRNTSVRVPLSAVDKTYKIAISSAVNYASQIGACFAMLLVVLTMTAKSRFARVPTIINMVNLVVAIIRLTLLVLFFPSTFLEPYTFFTGDVTYVSANDTRISIVATVFAIPQMLLVEMALIVQAWTMVQLWPSVWKWLAIVASAFLALVTFAFKCASVSVQIRLILEPFDVIPWLWIRRSDLGLTTAMIAWFCFLFNVRLVLHMWKHRSILPTVKGLSPMEVLVMANGILMFVPVLFAGLYFGNFGNFESGSLTATSVVLVLPLGTLVAQRLATSGSSKGPHGDSRDTDNGTLGSKRGFLGNYTDHSTGTGTGTARSRSFPVPKLSTKVQGGVQKHQKQEQQQQRGVDPVDLELARIDDDNDENSTGSGHRGGGVRVDHSIERREERL